ncbi:hypothetical protein Vadar_017415 [Vaccinium darrowii]|nr:hypothetical protein Vadar_017415 [Vaccinium darrowii]
MLLVPSALVETRIPRCLPKNNGFCTWPKNFLAELGLTRPNSCKSFLGSSTNKNKNKSGPRPKIGAENPTWNEKFLFRVSSRFLNGETSAVSVEIYAVGFINDPLIGTVRFLLNSHLSSAASGVGIDSPAFTAVHVRRPSSRFQGVLNIAVTILDGLEFGAVVGSSPAICFRDLMEKSRRRRRKKGSEKSDGESCDFSDGVERRLMATKKQICF